MNFKHITIVLINFYQRFLSLDRGLLSLLAPGGACKFETSCSEYMKQSIIKNGVVKGVARGLRRIINCR